MLIEEAIDTIYSNDLQALKELKERGFSYEEKDEEGKTLIFHAILENNLSFVEVLMKEGVAVNVKDDDGWTPLHYSVQDHLLEVTELLLKSNADVNAKDDYGNTVLWRAVVSSQGKTEIIELLKSHGANPDIENDSGVSARGLSQTIANYDLSRIL